jgi:hypothetical protein
MISIFMILVVGMRIALWIALKNKKPVTTAVSAPPVVAPPIPAQDEKTETSVQN